MSFSNQIKQFVQKAEARQVQVLQEVAKELGERLVKRTPVETGMARAHWQASINAPAAGPVAAVDPTGQQTIDTLNRAIEGAKMGDAIYIVNAAPHAQALEDGHSKQAPNGMVAATMLEAPAVIQDVIRKVASGAGDAT